MSGWRAFPHSQSKRSQLSCRWRRRIDTSARKSAIGAAENILVGKIADSSFLHAGTGMSAEENTVSGVNLLCLFSSAPMYFFIFLTAVRQHGFGHRLQHIRGNIHGTGTNMRVMASSPYLFMLYQLYPNMNDDTTSTLRKKSARLPIGFKSLTSHK